jgi:uncharacterized protein YjcR
LLSKMTIVEIASKFGISGSAVRKWMRLYDIEYQNKYKWSESAKSENAEKKRIQSVQLHTCKCGGYIRNLRAKMCRKCWLEH